jgi:hypothetical protein
LKHRVSEAEHENTVEKLFRAMEEVPDWLHVFPLLGQDTIDRILDVAMGYI